MSLNGMPVGDGPEEQEASTLSLKETSIRRACGMDGVAEANIRGVGWSPDGRMLALPGLENRVVVLDMKTGNEVVLLEGHTGAISCVDWSPTGKWLASVGFDQRLLVWSTDTWKAVKERTIGLGYGHLRRACTSHGGPLRFAPSIAWSSDGASLAAAGPDNRIFLWEGHSFTVNGILKLKNEKEATSAMAWSPDSLQVAAGTTTGTLLVYDSNGKSIKLEVHRKALRLGAITSLSWCPSPGPSVIAMTGVGRDRTVILVDADMGHVLRTLEGPEFRVYTCAWGPRGDWLATGGGDYKVTVWDTETGQVVNTLDGGHQSWVGTLSLSPNSRYLATISQDHRLVLWNVWHKQVTEAIEDVSEVKRLLEEAQGEKKDLQDRFEQREQLIRLLEGELFVAKEKLSAVRTASTRSIKSSKQLAAGRQRSQGAMTGTNPNGSSTSVRRSSSKSTVPHSDSTSSVAAKKAASRSSSRTGSMTGTNLGGVAAEDIAVTTADTAGLLDGVEGVQDVEEIEEPDDAPPAQDGNQKPPRPPSKHKVKSASSSAQRAATSNERRGDGSHSEGLARADSGEAVYDEASEASDANNRAWADDDDEGEGEDDDIDPEALTTLLEQSVKDMEQLKAELEEARRNEAELLDLSNSQAKREKELVAELEQLKAAAAAAAAVAIKAQEDLERFREESSRKAAAEKEAQALSATKRSSSNASTAPSSEPPTIKVITPWRPPSEDDDGEAPAPRSCMAWFNPGSSMRRTKSKVAAGSSIHQGNSN